MCSDNCPLNILEVRSGRSAFLTTKCIRTVPFVLKRALMALWKEAKIKRAFSDEYSNNPKGRVQRALPVGECEGGDMVCLGHGKPIIWTWSLPNWVSRCMDPEISPPYPESWSARLLEKTFPESHEELAGTWDHWAEYAGWSYPYVDCDSTEVWG